MTGALMVLKECFAVSIAIVEGFLPIIYGILVWGSYYFGTKSAEATIEKLFELIADSFIPWWFNLGSWFIVLISTLALYFLYLYLDSR